MVEERSETVTIMVTGVEPELRARVASAAGKLGLSVAAWVRMQLVLVLEREEKLR